MKTKLHEQTSWKTFIVPALILLVILGSALARPARSPVSGSGWADLYDGYAIGKADIAIRGVPQPQADVVVTLGTPRYSDEGVLHTTSEHIFYFGSGNSFTTEDKVIGDPTCTPGVYRLNETLRIVSGTGIFAGAVGNLTVHGVLDMVLGEVTYDIRGSISTP